MKLSSKIFLQSVLVLGTVSSAVHADGMRDDVHILMYETDSSLKDNVRSPLHFFMERSKVANVKTTVFGGNMNYRGFGDKYQSLRPLLEVVGHDSLIILADARDVALNVPSNEAAATKAIDRFVASFQEATKEAPHAVVMSAEAQCCVSALSHAHPTEYFNMETGERKKRSCASGLGNCLWWENDNIHSWVDFMRQKAFNVTGSVDNEDVYLNAGLMAGYPQDILRLLDVMDIAPEEDDQAVLTGLMYAYPNMITLDYHQQLFGNNQWPKGLIDGCVFAGQGEEEPLAHIHTATEPLIIHTPGKFYSCLDSIIEELGGTSQQRYLQDPTIRELMTKGEEDVITPRGPGSSDDDEDEDEKSGPGMDGPEDKNDEDEDEEEESGPGMDGPEDKNDEDDEKSAPGMDGPGKNSEDDKSMTEDQEDAKDSSKEDKSEDPKEEPEAAATDFPSATPSAAPSDTVFVEEPEGATTDSPSTSTSTMQYG
ncbi:MAG: hypothetical protein SGILL_007774 [Bacillariaceae sp.]